MLKNFKLNKSLIFFFLLNFFITAQPLMAANFSDSFSGLNNLNTFAGKANYSKAQDPEYYIGLFLYGFFSLLGIIFIGLILYSGFVWMTARGNDAKVTKAKDNLIDAIIGLIVIAGAYALTAFVLQIFSKPL